MDDLASIPQAIKDPYIHNIFQGSGTQLPDWPMARVLGAPQSVPATASDGGLYACVFAAVGTAAILAAVCMWPSQRWASAAAKPNWSSARTTMWCTMSSIVCG